MTYFDLLDTWPVDSVAAATISPDGTVNRHGDTGAVFELASITKLLTAAGVHLAAEEGSISLADDAGVLIEDDRSRGATLADVLAHGGGYGPKGVVLDDPGRRRIYSNGGYELLAHAVERGTEMAFADYLTEGLFQPLGMASTVLDGSAAYAARSTVDDLVRFITGLPQLLAPETVEAMTNPYLPELIGVLPGYGRQTPNVWGLGPEIRSNKTPHWTGQRNSPKAWGHFGQAGTFLWVDPQSSLAAVTLTNRTFGDWAIPLWPTYSDAVINELARPK